MAFNKVIVSIVLVAVYAVATQAQSAEQKPEQIIPKLPLAGDVAASGVPQNIHPRDKKFALYSAYSYSYPTYYSYPTVAAAPAVSYYSYQKAYPYAYSNAYYPGYYNYLI